MADFPYMPLWTDAYLSDTKHLSLKENGAYLLLLMIAWRTPTCSLPDDDKRIAQMLGLTPRQWKNMKPAIMDFWYLGEDGWVQKRLLAERKKAKKFITKEVLQEKQVQQLSD